MDTEIMNPDDLIKAAPTLVKDAAPLVAAIPFTALAKRILGPAVDEVGEMALNLQPKLLRALQEREIERLGDTRTREINIRVIATTNVSLRNAVAEGKFRADLYFRLNVIPLTLPPLRETPPA